MGSGKRRPDHRVNLVSAPRTLISGVALNQVELPMLAAFGAVKRFAVTKVHQIFKARIVIGELVEKVLNSRGFGHARNLLCP